MMLPTHALAGLLLALPVALAMPERAPVVLAAGFFGGILPDLDLYVGHRKTLHYPVYYAIAASGALVGALVFPSSTTIALTVFLAAAAVHCLMDLFGGGLELRPWAGTSRKAVYSHYHGRWLRPRRWVRYDGAPEDLVLSVVFAVPLLVLFAGVVRWVVIACLSVAIVYVVLRKWLAAVAQALASYVPSSLRRYVPERYLES